MNQLIAVFPGTIQSKQVQLCNARDIHSFLGVKRDFSTWIKERIEEYGFIENEDFITCSPKLGSKIHGGQNRKDYHATIGMGKELSMVERTEKGRQVRRYFIECEKRLLNPTVSQHTTQQFPPIDAGDLACLKAAVAGMAYRTRRSTQAVYAALHHEFGVNSVNEIPHFKYGVVMHWLGENSTFRPVMPQMPSLPDGRWFLVVQNGKEIYRQDAAHKALVDISAVNTFKAHMKKLSEAALQMGGKSGFFLGANIGLDELEKPLAL